MFDFFFFHLDVPSTQKFIFELQKLAKNSGHKYPLLIAVDQENGMVNSLYDKNYLTQFPGNMAIVATQSTTMAIQVAEATGRELKAVGINWILGPVVDVLTDTTSKKLGVRSMGDDPEEVAEYTLALLEGFRRAGIVTCGKHFPGYGSSNINSESELPEIQDSLDQLKTGSLVPFQAAIDQNIDSIMVGGCALPNAAIKEKYACLSEQVVNSLLRNQMGYNGVVVSECLEMQYLYETVGVSQGAMMAALAGCDVIMVCTQHRLQMEALVGILAGLRDKTLSADLVHKSSRRVSDMKRRYLSWDEALNPSRLSKLARLTKSHQNLSLKAYDRVITLVRDKENFIPLSKSIDENSNILLLTPHIASNLGHCDSKNFAFLGRALLNYYTGKLRHTIYTENGLIDQHRALINDSKAIILITTDATRHEYQINITKVVAALCNQQQIPLIVIAGSSPYDMALDRSIGTYLCIYEFTEPCLIATAKVLFGRLSAVGKFPGKWLYQNQHMQFLSSSRQRWLVEEWKSDQVGIMDKFRALWRVCFAGQHFEFQIKQFINILSTEQKQKHFCVKNTSTNEIYGFCGTWVHSDQHTGSIFMLFVDPTRRRMAIGKSLHERALKYLAGLPGLKRITLGAHLPGWFAGIPLLSEPSSVDVDIVSWFKNNGWDIPLARKNSQNIVVHTMVLDEVPSWCYPDIVFARCTNIKFDIISRFRPLLPSSESWLGLFGPTLDSFEIMHKLQRFFSSFEALPSGILELYRLALSDVSNTTNKSGISINNTNVTVAIDDASGEIVASIVSFTCNSKEIAQLQPWIFDFGNARVSGLCGLLGQTPAARQGIVAFQLGQHRLQQDVDRCVLYGVKGSDDKSLMRELRFVKNKSFLVVQRNVTGYHYEINKQFYSCAMQH